ncbi:hypothetical protein GobsT_07690 [Gemmata obscuriglobus]|uniref:Uncharacterized protein n=1 Tax=Gemmata obscuriglobus TaxID=114 RepID=A0A2Z3HB12_9BACT|nr:hypothetical protein [Gemmata obscuriglobus]AWM40697.1 hypothetical protein C1280_29405 [Gemmata obscuriglobus]QEG26034.1 hypothetical protein GobsT_07690 [Gemmata obscuriglobus]VTS00385.1 Uncharacterized protein OS=Cupriavidus sp. SK-3 GN=CF70_017220 PE=4 SV=1 [Gemmata obscuriglobus UQM 2246]
MQEYVPGGCARAADGARRQPRRGRSAGRGAGRAAGSGCYAPGAEKYRGLGPGADKGLRKQAAEEYYRPPRLDYFKDTDAVGSSGGDGAQPLARSGAAIKGRNAWTIWAAGNEAWWDGLARYGYGTIDLPWLPAPGHRDARFARTWLVNEPGTRLPFEGEDAQTYRVRFARPIRPDDGPCRVLPGDAPEKRPPHVGYRPAVDGEKWYDASSYDPSERKHPDEYPVYGYPTGVVVLRLFPIPRGTPINALACIGPETPLANKPDRLSAPGAEFLKCRDVKPGDTNEDAKARGARTSI